MTFQHIAIDKLERCGLSNTEQHAPTQGCQSWCCTSHRSKCVNYLVVATRQSASVIKVNEWMHSNECKKKPGSSFTVTI